MTYGIAIGQIQAERIPNAEILKQSGAAAMSTPRFPMFTPAEPAVDHGRDESGRPSSFPSTAR